MFGFCSHCSNEVWTEISAARCNSPALRAGIKVRRSAACRAEIKLAVTQRCIDLAKRVVETGLWFTLYINMMYHYPPKLNHIVDARTHVLVMWIGCPGYLYIRFGRTDPALVEGKGRDGSRLRVTRLFFWDLRTWAHDVFVLFLIIPMHSHCHTFLHSHSHTFLHDYHGKWCNVVNLIS